MPETMLEAALRYAALGWYVFPLRSKNGVSAKGEKRDMKTPHPMLGEDGGHTKASKDAKQIKAWWSKDEKAGIGLWLAKSGLIAIDIDPREAGDVQMAALEAQHSEAKSPVTALTGRGDGGEHRLFLAPPAGTSVPGKLAPKGIELKYNGYIVLAPSLHPDSGKPYRWVKGKSPEDGEEFLMPLPAWCYGPRARNETTGIVDPDDVFAADVGRVDLPLEEIGRRLMLIPNGGGSDGEQQDYDTWLEIGMGLYHQTDGSDDGKTLWEEWSEQNTEHVQATLDRKWESFDHSDKGRAPVTARRILQLAKPYAEAITLERVTDVKEEIQTAADFKALKVACGRAKLLDLEPAIREGLATLVKAAFKRIEGTVLPLVEARKLLRREDAAIEKSDLPDWLDGWVYLAAEDRFYNHKSGALISPASFDRAHGRALLNDQDRREGKASAGVAASEMALNVFRVPAVDSRVYLPNEGTFFRMEGRDRINTYSESGVVVARGRKEWTAQEKADVERVSAHFDMLFPDARDAGLLRSWLSYVAKEKKRVGFSAVLQSVDGAGKTFFAEMMAACLGSRNVGTVTAAEVESEFNAWAEGRLLVVVEEMRMRGHNRFDGLNRIKPLITNETITVRRMRTDAVSVPNTASYLIFTNYRDALPIDERDRRHMILFSRFQTEESIKAFVAERPEYFDELFDGMRRSVGAVKGWLLGLKRHPDFKPGTRAPTTAHRAAMIELSKPEEQTRVEDVLRESRDGLLSRAFIQYDRLLGALGDGMQEIPGDKTITRVLSDMGFTSLGQIRVGSDRHRYWTTEPEKFVQGRGPDAQLIRKYVDDHDL